jgi:hypothetical protein
MNKIGYLILAHSDPLHLSRLINILNGNCDFYIHIDAKSDIHEFNRIPLSENTFFIKDRVNISWGGISMVDATLNLIKEALDSGNQYSHLVLLSGSCYPIKPPEYINYFFNQHPNREFIRFIDMRESQQHYMKQIKLKWFKEPLFSASFKPLQVLDKGIRKAANFLGLENSWDENTIIPYFGSQWWALTPSCCKYILDYINENNNYYSINKFTFSPDEHFFHTLVGNSVYKKNSDGLQAFEGRGTFKLANFHIIHPSLSKWYDLTDWDEIFSSDKLFVRKVNSLKSKVLLDKIDKELLTLKL